MDTRIIIGIIVAVALTSIALGVFLSLHSVPFKPQFADILNLTVVNNSNELLRQMEIGIKNNTDFNITYSIYAIFSSNPLYSGLRYSANASLSRYDNLLSVSLSTQSPSFILNGQQNSNVYISSSIYNGSGFLLCYENQPSCAYKKANQNGNFAGEIASAFSNVFNGNFLSSPYLVAMNGNYSISNSSDFVLSYLSSQRYEGNDCAYMRVSSTSVFYDSVGATVSGYACFSEALGLPLYAKLTVTRSSLSFNIDISSSLTNKTNRPEFSAVFACAFIVAGYE